MKKKRLTEEQVVKTLNEVENGALARDVCKKHNVTEQTSTAGARGTAAWR